MTFRLRSSVIRDPSGKVKFRRVSETFGDHYHIGVWLDSSDPAEMDQVERVEYQLHTTFPNRDRKSENRRNDFSITFWAWGAFEIFAKVYVSGSTSDPVDLSHELEIKLPADTGDNYVQVK